jgi:hypothetical protein
LPGARPGYEAAEKIRHADFDKGVRGPSQARLAVAFGAMPSFWDLIEAITAVGGWVSRASFTIVPAAVPPSARWSVRRRAAICHWYGTAGQCA